MRRKSGRYRLLNVPGGEKKREKERERFPVGSFHRKSLAGRAQASRGREKKTDQKPTHTVAMTHLLLCGKNTNLHALVVWRDLTYMCAQA